MSFNSRMPEMTTARYAAIISTIGFFISLGSMYVAKLSYDVNARKEIREISEKRQAVDIQVTPDGASSASMTISIINRGDVNVVPQDITVLPSLEAGEFYLSSNRQSVDQLKSWLSLGSMGTIAPKASGSLKARVSGVTDGKDDAFQLGVELQFIVRVRLGDNNETMETQDITRRVQRH
jgi:archaellum component FlaF (FlaF/FlaG flagellin family)